MINNLKPKVITVLNIEIIIFLIIKEMSHFIK